MLRFSGPRSLALGSVQFLVACFPAAAAAQCLLANPSFEVAGDQPAVFGGWNQFGDVGSIPQAVHGSHAARVTGPDAAGWGVSAFWQRLDAAPGQQFTVTACVSHPSTQPLTGDSRAIINVEWRNAAGNLIDYESHEVADATTPPDEMRSVTLTSAAAPPGTASTHLLLGVLQSPDDPAPTVHYDQVTFENSLVAQPESPQWLDFPGGRTLSFSGFAWRVKGPITVAGIPYRDGEDFVWVDAQDRLHLTLSYRDGTWNNTEVALSDPLGYGDYVFTTGGDLDAIDPQAVLGLFLWQYTPCYLLEDSWWNPNNEIDIEFSRWGDASNPIGEFVVQPYFVADNMLNFDTTFEAGERTSHAFHWSSDRIEFRSWRGGPFDESPETLIQAWVYDGPHVARPEQPRVHVNLHKLAGEPSTDQEIVLESFRFVPECSGTDCADLPSDAMAALTPTHRLSAWPNPFNPQTTIRVTVERTGTVALRIFDVSGRLVRTLLHDVVDVGPHEVSWNGRNDQGQRLPSGVYLLQFQAERSVESRRLVLLK